MGLCSHARDRKRATGGDEGCADSSGTREPEGHTRHLYYVNRNQVDDDTLSQQQQERNMAVPAAACWSSGRIPILFFLSNRSVLDGKQSQSGSRSIWREKIRERASVYII